MLFIAKEGKKFEKREFLRPWEGNSSKWLWEHCCNPAAFCKIGFEPAQTNLFVINVEF